MSENHTTFLPDIKIELSHQNNWRNKQEFYTIPVAECKEYDVKYVSHGLVLGHVIENLRQMSLDPSVKIDINRPLRIMRKGMTCFEVKPLKSWFKTGNRQPEHLKKENWSKDENA